MFLATNLCSVGALKVLKRFAILSVLASVVASVIATLKQNKSTAPTSFEEWPDVPHNPEA
jgi:hypothetical protein